MRKIFALLFCCYASMIYAQHIKTNTIDKFTKLKVIETSPVQVKNVILGGISFALAQNGNTLALVATGFGSYSVNIGSNDALIFLLENDSTVTVFPPDDLQFSKESAASVYNGYYVNGQKTFKQLYFINRKQIELLRNIKIKSIRRYHTEGSMDIDIKGGNKDDLMKLADVFIKAIDK